MDIRSTVVTLGDKDYQITELGWKAAAKWKRALIEEVQPLFEQVAGLEGIKFETPNDLMQLWPLINLLVVDSIELLFKHLAAYSPEIKADKKYIEDAATEAQIYEAFKAVLEFADPFGLTRKLTRPIGSPKKATITNSPVPSGE